MTAPVPQPMSRRRSGLVRGAWMTLLCMISAIPAAWASRRACSVELGGFSQWKEGVMGAEGSGGGFRSWENWKEGRLTHSGGCIRYRYCGRIFARQQSPFGKMGLGYWTDYLGS